MAASDTSSFLISIPLFAFLSVAMLFSVPARMSVSRVRLARSVNYRENERDRGRESEKERIPAAVYESVAELASPNGLACR